MVIDSRYSGGDGFVGELEVLGNWGGGVIGEFGVGEM